MNVPELGDAGTRLWNGIAETRSIDATTYALVLNACRIVDRLDEMQEYIADSPLVMENDKGDNIANPLIIEHRQQSMALRNLLAALGIGKLSEVMEDEEGSMMDQIQAAMKTMKADS